MSSGQSDKEASGSALCATDMTLVGVQPKTRSPSRRSHGLRDIYEVPTSRSSSPLIPRHSPQPLPVKKTIGKSRAKPALKLSRKPAYTEFRYERTINGAGKTQDHIIEELGHAGRNFPGETEQIQSAQNSGAGAIEPQQDGIPEVAKQRLMEMALEGLYVAGDLSLVDNAGDNAESVHGRRKAVTQQATIPVEYQTAKLPNRKDFNTATYPGNRFENEEFHTVQHRETLISTLENGRLSIEKDIPGLIINEENSRLGDKESSESDVHALNPNTVNADIASKKRQIEAIEDLRMNEDGCTDFLIKWEGVDYELATWEHEETVVSSAPRLLIQYLKAMVFADQRIEEAERDNGLNRNQLSIDVFQENDSSMLENTGRIEEYKATETGQGFGHDDTIKDSQSFGEGEPIGHEQLLRSESAMERNRLGTAEPPATKRRRGRSRKSDSSTSSMQASRQATTVTVSHLEMLGVSTRNGFWQAFDTSSESESGLSQRDFLMPSAEEVLEAARELAKSRESREFITEETTPHRKHLVENKKSRMSISSNDPYVNPYKKYYLTGQSNRRINSRGVARSQFRRAARSVHPPPKLMTREPGKVNERLVPGNTVVVRRRGRPPGSRNKNARPVKIQARIPSHVLRSSGIRKAGPGRKRVTSSENNSFSSIQPSKGSEVDQTKTQYLITSQTFEGHNTDPTKPSPAWVS